MFKPREIDDTLADITSGASGDDEQLRAFHARFATTLRLPVMALLCGKRVQIVAVEYLGNPRRGITLRAFEGERTLSASILDLTLPGKSAGALTLAALKRWAGAEAGEAVQHQIEATGSDVIEAFVTKVGSLHVRLRVVGSPQEITHRSSGSDVIRLVPGHLVRVKPNNRWTHRGVPYVAGEVVEARVDVAALGLPPLELREEGTWTPADEELFSDEGPLADLWREIAGGPRTEFEMEQVLPGADPDDPDTDPILLAVELHGSGQTDEARDALMALLHQDLRCLDAHAHLGNWSFTSYTLATALAHYEVGVRIGEQALGSTFEGVLPWGHVDNRPFLRCLNGFGLALWRSKRFEEALTVFENMLRLNPEDHQGARFNWHAVRDGRAWQELEQDDQPALG
jgi:hypothetical protein